MRDTLSMIREAIGEESYLLGCIAPFLPFIGYADGMRIAGDVGAQWEGAYGPVNMLRELFADNYFQNIYWQNDPDCILLRHFANSLSETERESLALLQALSGGITATSDPLHRLDERAMALLRMIKPTEDAHKPSLPHLEEECEERVVCHSLPQGQLLYVLNPADHPLTVAVHFDRYFPGTDQKLWYVRRWHRGACEQPKTSYDTVLRPHESMLLFLTERPLVKEPENLWVWE